MAYDTDLADRVRGLIAAERHVDEKPMFGGLAFLIGGHMAVCVSGRGGLMVRVPPEQTEQLLGLDHVEPMMQWLDAADPHHVQDFVDRLRKGKKLKPVLLVQTPGADRPLLVDGHHRYLACKAEGVPVRAFIGTVDADHGPWEVMHDYQLHPSSATPANARREQAIWNQLAGVR